MPGRVSTRNITTTRIPRKSSVPTLNSRGSTTSRISSPALTVPDEGPETSLRTSICAIFGDAQKSTAGHRKLVVSLRKIHEACCYEPSKPGNKSVAQYNEDDFNVEVARCVIRLVGVKKAEGVGDRMIRFLGQFLRHASEKDAALVPESEIDETHSFPETPSSRLTCHILSILLPLFVSKEKTVRYRATQIISHIINSLDSIDDEYYQLVRTALLKRIRDKEPTVRVQAALGLSRLAGNEDEDDQEEGDSDDDEASGVLEKLLELLQNDSSADVRRSLLMNLPLTPTTLPYLLERARDLDPGTRRALYSRLLPALGDFRHLSLSMREKLLRWGLRDRDEIVRKATARLFSERWIGDCAGSKIVSEDGKQTQVLPPNIDALLELLERIDVVNSGAESGVALEALKEFWQSRPDYRDAIAFEDSFWDQLSAESAFLVRSLNDFCRNGGGGKYESLIEEKMPEVTRLAFILQRYTNNIVERIRHINALPEGAEEEDTAELEFIVEQLLHIAQTLDYTDEVGRRKMFALLREILSIAELPEEITKLVVEVLRGVCGFDAASEREFCGVVLEAVAEVHDTITVDEQGIDEDESFHSARSEVSDSTVTGDGPNKKLLVETEEQSEEKAIREIMVNMKCLHIAQCMLENVVENLQDNVHLVTMLNNLVVPAVRSHEAPIRERGLQCLGLCCLLDKNLASENLVLFIHCYTKGHETLQITALHILCDILTTHPSLLPADASSELQKPLFKCFAKAIKTPQSPLVQAAAVIGLSKLMLVSVITNDELLSKLVICYFEPSTRENAAVQQALTYFLPVYAHSRRENMERMGRVALGVVHTLIGLGEEIEEDEEMVGMNVVIGMLADWTDARRLVSKDEGAVTWDEAGRKEVKAVDGDIHLDLAAEVLEKVLSSSCSREEKKTLISILPKLHVSATSSPDKLQLAYELVAEAIDNKIASDATSRNALTKLHVALGKVVGEAGTEPKTPGKSRKSVVNEGIAAAEEEEVVEKMEAMELEAEGAEEAKLEDVAEEREEETKVQDSLLEELLDEDKDL